MSRPRSHSWYTASEQKCELPSHADQVSDGPRFKLWNYYYFLAPSQSYVPLKGYYECGSLGRSLGLAQSQFSLLSDSMRAPGWPTAALMLGICSLHHSLEPRGPGKPPAPPLPVHVPCEGPGPRARRGLRDVPEGVPPRSGAEGDIWAGMEDEAERSLSPVALKLRGTGGSSATLVVTGAREQSQR